MLSNFGRRAIHIPKHTVVRLALPSPSHILTLGESAAEAAEAKKGGGIFNSNPSSAEDAAGEAANNGTDKGRAEQATPPRAPLGADGPHKLEDTAAPEGEPNSRQEDVHIGVEDEEARSEVFEVQSEFKDMWTGRLGKTGATKHCIKLKTGPRPNYQAPYRIVSTAREKEKTEIDRMLREGVIESATGKPSVIRP